MFNKFFAGNHVIYQIVRKNVTEQDRTQTTMQHGAEKVQFSCRITKARIQTHNHNINTYYFSTAIAVMRTRLSFTLYVHCLSCC